MPDSASGKVPAVVLVHGSGPQDMDSTVFTNKPFRDIAEHLAQNGIAVIRYNKRTLTYGGNFGGLTVREETIDDAVLAVNMLKTDPRIDENKVFILGHSLGGMLAPRIHAEGGDFAGLILFASSPRFLTDISKTQNLLAIEAMDDDADKDAALISMEQWDDFYMAFLALPDEEAKNTEVPGWGGVSAYYFKDMYENPAADYLTNVTVPILVMHADNDFQVLTDIDFALYKELLAGRDNVTLKLYEGLNHLFMVSTARNVNEIIDEYAVPSRVDERVLEDILNWINRQ